MTKSPSKKILILLSLLVLGICVLYYFVFVDIKHRSEHASMLLHDVTYEIGKQQYMVSLENIIQSSDSDITRVNNSIIAKDGDVAFIENFEAMAKVNGLSITIDSLDLEDNPALNANNIAVLRIKAKTQGNWSGSYAFLTELESLPLKIKVERFGFANMSDDAKSGAKKSAKTNHIWQSIFEILVLKYK